MKDKSIVMAEGEGEKLWFLGGGVHTWKVTTEDTDGALFAFEDTMERGKTTPLHRHPGVTEIAYVIEGEILVYVPGGEPRRVGQGGVVVNPAGVEHAFCVVSEVARILSIQTPGTGEGFYRGASVAMPESGGGPVDFGKIREVATATGTTVVVGPPPFRK
jgi:quercetin dioxygenase-like cupin family protein